MKNKLFLALVLLSLPFTGLSQVLVNGLVSDAATSVPISDVFVYVPETNSGTVTNAEGNYELQNLKNGHFVIQFSRIGYETHFENIALSDSIVRLDIKLSTSLNELKEVKVIGTQTNSPTETSFTIDAISLKEMQDDGALSISDGVAKLPGVSQLTTGAGISKPVIRGLYGNRVQVNVMGLRFDNQQWQDEHGIGLSDIGISRVEVIKGPATLMYGSDAQGGVINVIEEAPAPANTTNQELNLRLFSNTYGLSANYGLKKSDERKWWRLRVGGENHSDYSSTGNTRVLNSRFTNYNVKSSAGFNRENWVHSTNAYVSFSQFGFVFDSLERKVLDGRLSRTFDGPHHRVLFGLVSTENTLYRGKTKYKLNGGLITNLRQEQEGGNRISLNMLLNTISTLGQMIRQVGSRGEWANGISLMFQTNTNFGARTIIPDANTLEASVFSYYKQRFSKIILEGGVRYDRRQIQTFETGTINGPGKEVQPFSNGFDALNGSLGIVYNPMKNLSMKANASTGYRSGNLAELSSNGLHEGTLRWEAGDPDLKIEQNLNLEVGLGYKLRQQLELGATVFRNQFKNYIYLAPTGTEYVGFLIYNFVQTDATIQGFEASLDIHPSFIKWLDINGSYTYLEAQKADGTALPFIPANKARIEVKSSFAIRSGKLSSWHLKVGGNSVFAQNKPDVFETSTPAYFLLDAAVGGSFKLNNQTLNITLVSTNLTDLQYVDHLSRFKYYGLYNMGRNISLVMNLKF